MTRKLLLCALLLMPNVIFANTDFDFTFQTDYQTIDLSAVSIEDIGIAGVHTQFNPSTWHWYGGAAVYGAVKGEYSGFFALGLEAGYRRAIYENLEVDLGGMIGAGGGHDIVAYIADGNMVEGRIGLKYPLFGLKAGLSYAHFRFLDTDIRSNHFIFSLETSDIFTRYPFREGNRFQETAAQYRKYLAFVAASYHPRDHVTDVSNNPDTDSTQFVGVEYVNQIAPAVYFTTTFKGSVAGHKHGYADLLLGLAYKHALGSDNFRGLVKAKLGTGGGGGVDTGSGLIAHPQLGLEYQFSPRFAIELDGGWLAGLSNDYEALTASAQLNIYLNQRYQSQRYDLAARLGHQTYIEPDKETQTTPADNIDLVALKVDNYFSDNLYFSGQTAFAYTGKVAGYFSGLIGVGYEYPLLPERVSIVGELLAGAAGGAGLDLGEGFIVAPNLGINYHLSSATSLYALGGLTEAPQGGFSALTIEFGLRHRFALRL